MKVLNIKLGLGITGLLTAASIMTGCGAQIVTGADVTAGAADEATGAVTLSGLVNPLKLGDLAINGYDSATEDSSAAAADDHHQSITGLDEHMFDGGEGIPNDYGAPNRLKPSEVFAIDLVPNESDYILKAYAADMAGCVAHVDIPLTNTATNHYSIGTATYTVAPCELDPSVVSVLNNVAAQVNSIISDNPLTITLDVAESGIVTLGAPANVHINNYVGFMFGEDNTSDIVLVSGSATLAPCDYSSDFFAAMSSFASLVAEE